MSGISFNSYRITGNSLIKMLKEVELSEVAWILMSIFALHSGPFTRNTKEQEKLFTLFFNLQKNEPGFFHGLLMAMKSITRSSHDWPILLQHIYTSCISQENPKVTFDEVIFVFDGSIINQLYGEISQKTWDLFRSYCEEIKT